MITRSAAARRRHIQHHIATSFAQLSLPWLAPAQLRWMSLHASKATTQHSRRKSIGRGRHTVDASRRLATAADVYPSNEAYDSFPDRDGHYHLYWNRGSTSASSSQAENRHSLNPVMLPLASDPPPKALKVQHGIVGNTQELLQHLHTNLRVGRMQRARAIMTRLSLDAPLDSAEVCYAHKLYLDELLRKLMSHAAGTKEAQNVRNEMQEWFEQEVQERGVRIDAQTLVPMVRAAAFALLGESRDEAIRTYASLASASGEDVYEDVVFADDYTDPEFSIISEATGQHIDEDLKSQFADATGQSSLATLATLAEGELAEVSEPQSSKIDKLPVVLATPQRGLGLDGLKHVFKQFAETTPDQDVTAETSKAIAIERQRILEETSVDVAIERWRKADEELQKIGINTAMQTRPIAALMWQWHSALVPALKEELAECKKLMEATTRVKDNDRLHYGPYLELLSPEQIAAQAVVYLLATVTARRRDKLPLQTLSVAPIVGGMGRAIEAECKALHHKDRHGRPRRGFVKAARTRQNRKASKMDGSKVTEDKERFLAWPTSIRIKLGSMVLSKIIQIATLPVTREHIRTKEKVTQLQPAFSHRTEFVRGKRVGLLAPHSALISKLRSEPVASLLAKRMPMIVEPQPWTQINKGAYYHYQNPVMRYGVGEQQGKEYMRAAHEQGDLKQVYAGLNALGKVPWRINRDVFKVQLEAWNSGEAVGNLAPLNPQYDLPPEPEPSADPTPRRRWLNLIREIEHKKAGAHSERCFQNFQLETARSMINERLYFPHNLDFRGRAYPLPPYLNHMAADNARGILVFADGKRLGEEGLRWLKIHLANVAGYDKASLQEREDFTMSHLDDIRDSVADPLGGRKWWLQSEDAWQTLAACFELIHALDSPDPTEFISHLPVHQDGTCNGLQHYAALGGDKVGALHVNLEPGERPADLYSSVAKAVSAEVDSDVAQGHPIAKVLQGHITRKVVKTPVMTNVYGVTFFGAMLQVQKQIEVVLPNLKSYDVASPRAVATYVARKIFKSLGSMFTGAQALQVWLEQCAELITTSLTPEQIEQLISPPGGEDFSAPAREKEGQEEAKKGKRRELRNKTTTSAKDEIVARPNTKALFKSTVVWTTPLRLPVVQPYRSVKGKQIISSVQTITLQEPQLWDPVSRKKQLQAFPPNFIHSLDATHMLLSALKCTDAGITFASIHDSFWTHASDVTRMSEMLRDAFVEMHREDVIGRLREEFQTRYAGSIGQIQVLRVGELGQEIFEWRKNNAAILKEPYAELALETKRAKLIQSSDEGERAEGLAMVTPASIFDARGGMDIWKNEFEESRGGAIPADDDWLANEDTPVDTSQATDYVQPPSKQKLAIWRAIEFPAVPEKGDFDVNRLKGSKYFFH